MLKLEFLYFIVFFFSFISIVKGNAEDTYFSSDQWILISRSNDIKIKNIMSVPMIHDNLQVKYPCDDIVTVKLRARKKDIGVTDIVYANRNEENGYCTTNVSIGEGVDITAKYSIELHGTKIHKSTEFYLKNHIYTIHAYENLEEELNKYISRDDVPSPVFVQSHNDETRKMPLFDALNAGCQFVEVDIYSENGNLYAAHDKGDRKNGRSLTELYLDPLRYIIKKNKKVFKNSDSPLYLMFDVKGSGKDKEEALTLLENIIHTLADDNELKLQTRDGKDDAHIEAIISGINVKDFESYKFADYASLDVKFNEIDKDPKSVGLKTTSKKFQYRFDTRTLTSSKIKIVNDVKKAENKNRLLRYWDGPESQANIKLLLDSGIKIINTDKVNETADFVRQYYQNLSK